MLRQGQLSLRQVEAADVDRLLEIYAPYITDSVVSFEEVVPSADEFARRVLVAEQVAPFFVATIDTNIVGFAYAGRHRDRAAYRWSVEVSIYIDRCQHRAGVGRTLYQELLGSLRALGYYNALAVITLPNQQSVGFHEALGFKQVATYPAIGFKHGRWLSVGWWHLPLRDPLEHPQEPRSL